MLEYSARLLQAHAALGTDLLELLPAEVPVPVSVPDGEGDQDLVLVLPPPLLPGQTSSPAAEPAQAVVLQ